MKKTIQCLVLLAGILLVFTTGLKSGQGSGLNYQTPISTTLPDSIDKIVQKSCIACHSNDGVSMAKMKLNFDNWNSYGEKKQLSKAEDICNEVTKAKMPPRGYRENNPESVPADKEIKTICAWAGSFQK
jgi:cytochrome c5